MNPNTKRLILGNVPHNYCQKEKHREPSIQPIVLKMESDNGE